VRATLEVRQSHSDAFPQRICLHEDLINVYQGLDPLGYAPLIENALEYMEKEISPGMSCESCLRSLRADFYRSTEYPQAAETAWEHLSKSGVENRVESYGNACLELCHTLAIVEGFEARGHLAELSAEGYEVLSKAKITYSLHEALMWQALAARWNGDSNAPRALKRALNSRAKYGAAARPGYYHAAVFYYEADQNDKKAVQMLDEELQEIEGHSEFWREATRRLKKCELLRSMGLPFESELEKIREVTKNLKDPTLIEAKLAAFHSSG
jgi:hypothetical protein